MKKIMIGIIAMMILGAGTVLAAEVDAVQPRAVVIDSQETRETLYSGATGKPVGTFTHYSTYGVPSGGSGTYRVIQNTCYDLSTTALHYECTTMNNNQTAVAIVDFNGDFKTKFYHYY